MPAPKDLIHESSATTGTGNFTLTAVNGKVRFSDSTYAFGTGSTTDVFDYFISNRDAAEWERGTGHMSDANTLVRDTVLASSNSNNAVSFSAGTKDVTNDVPAAKQVTTESSIGVRNYLVNGGFTVWQQGTSFTSASSPANSDDTYTADQWITLSDGNDIVDVTRESTTVPSSSAYAIRLDVETVDKKFGIFQPLENRDSLRLIGSTATLSFKARTAGSGKLDNVKAAIVTWSSTADSITSDIVSAWGVEGTNPTLATNWTYENTPANLNLTTSYATYTVSASIDTASAANIGVFIWSDVTDTDLGDFLYIADVQLEMGSTAHVFSSVSAQLETVMAQRFYERVQPGVSSGDFFGAGSCDSTTDARFPILFTTEKRIAPTVLTSGTATDFTLRHAGNNTTLNGVPTDVNPSPRSTVVFCPVASGLTAGRAAYLRVAANDPWIAFDARL